jgi:hypothetical protein
LTPPTSAVELTPTSRRHAIAFELRLGDARFSTEADEVAAEGRAMTGKSALKCIIVEDDLSERDIEILKNTAKPRLVSRVFGHGLIGF